MGRLLDGPVILKYTLYPVWPLMFVLFLLLAIRDIVRQKDAGFWGQKAVVAALALMVLMAELPR